MTIADLHRIPDVELVAQVKRAALDVTGLAMAALRDKRREPAVAARVRGFRTEHQHCHELRELWEHDDQALYRALLELGKELVRLA